MRAGRARPALARGVEPRGHVLGSDAVGGLLANAGRMRASRPMRTVARPESFHRGPQRRECSPANHPNLTNQKMPYVEISRAQDRAL